MALGISIPTSTTGVATSTSILPSAKPSRISFFSFAFSLPCKSPTLKSLNISLDNVSNSLTAAFTVVADSDSSMKGQIIKTWFLFPFSSFSSIFFLIHSYPDSLFSLGTSQVFTLTRPAGISSSMESARSPYNVKNTVLGIGVAVIVKKCGVPDLDLKTERCSTPNLCCSSITTNPTFSKLVLEFKRACVPI